jgi:Ca-activated chloride channel family protein
VILTIVCFFLFVEAHMKYRVALLSVIFLAFAFFFPMAPAQADGIIIPDPPICLDCPPPPCRFPFPCPKPTPMMQLVVRYHRVQVTIQDQVAVTHVDQVFFNPNDWAVEGVYLFPLPVDAAVSSFELWVDGKPVEGQMLDAEQARQEYQEIVNSLRDPALLEYAGRGAVQARIFPIAPQGERRIELEYTQALPAEGGLVRYVYPMNTEKFSLWPIENVSISVEMRASVPIRAVYSPSHTIAVDREGETQVSVGYEATQVLPDKDFALFYSLGEQEAFHILSYRDPGDKADPDGFFLLLLAPRPEAAAQALPKDVVLVLDRSGSMEGEKFRQAQDALRYILQHLNSEDRFNVIAFSTGLESYAPALRPAAEAAEAMAWVERLSAQGSTDINRSMLEAAAITNPERPTYLIFLTDGLPTEGVVDSQQILDNFQAAAPHSLRLFAFGVGYDVDTFLLDSLAQAHHGTSSYVLPGERLDETLSAFYAKISTPVLTDLALDFGGLTVYDLYPTPLPDLFSGSQIILVGRYRQGGTADVTLTGVVNGQTQTYRYAGQVFSSDSRGQDVTLAALPRLWATRKIGYLLNQIRLKGPDQETIDQIVHLSIRYGIVTPYTSYLVTEPLPLGAAEQQRIAADQYNQLQATGAAPSSGQEAVQKAADQASMAQAEAPAAPSGEAASTVRVAGSRTFVFSGGKWVDTAFDPEGMQTVEVVFLSDEYFALAEARPELASAFALGQAVIALSDGLAYEVVLAGTDIPPTESPATGMPRPTQSTLLSTLTSTPIPSKIATSPVGKTLPPTPVAPGPRTCTAGLLAIILLPLTCFISVAVKRIR